jgi:hypothetical protein
MTEEKGPAYLLPCPDRLKARVVRPGPEPLLHGYDVERDLARSFGFGEVILLALTGREPERERGRAFEAAMTFLSAISVAEAPAHAAVLARVCASPAAPLFGSTAIAAGERARAIVSAHAWVLEWMRGGELRAHALGEEDARAREALIAAIGPGAPELLRQPLSRTAALIALLVWCGLDSEERLISALALAALPASLAEGLAARPLSFDDYPIRLPEFDYED